MGFLAKLSVRPQSAATRSALLAQPVYGCTQQRAFFRVNIEFGPYLCDQSIGKLSVGQRVSKLLLLPCFFDYMQSRTRDRRRTSLRWRHR